MSHDFINTGDKDAHSGICDQYGEVVLSQCRACGQAEGDLQPVCPKAKAKRAPAKKHPAITMGCVAAILGVSKSMTRAQVLRQMVREYHGAESEYVPNIAAEYNDLMREPALAAFEDQMRRNVIRVDIAKPLYKWLSSHPMTVKSDKFEGPGLVFLRTPFGQREVGHKSQFKSLDEQPHMYAQMQVEMHLAGCKWGVFFQWAVSAQTAKIVELDEAFVKSSIDQLQAFYDEVYKPETKNKDHLEPLLKNIDNKRTRDALTEYDELAVVITNAKARQDELLEILKKEAKDNSVSFNGRKLLKVTSEGSVSYAQVVKKHLPDLDLSPYRSDPKTSWKLY